MNRNGNVAIVTSVVVLALAALLYPLSLGPVTRLFNEDLLPEWFGVFYTPLLLLAPLAPESVQNAFDAYIDLWLQTL